MTLEKLLMDKGGDAARVIDVLWRNNVTSVTVAEISSEIGVDYSYVNKMVVYLNELNLVKKTVNGYQLNSDNETALTLIKLLDSLEILFSQTKVPEIKDDFDLQVMAQKTAIDLTSEVSPIIDKYRMFVSELSEPSTIKAVCDERNIDNLFHLIEFLIRVRSDNNLHMRSMKPRT